MKRNTVKNMMAVMTAMALLAPGYRALAEEITVDTQEEMTEAEAVEEAEEEEVISDGCEIETVIEEEYAEFIIEPEEEPQVIVEAPAAEAVQTETGETETEAESETESETEKDAAFKFENDEVIIKASIDSEAELPENLEMIVKKVEEDSDTFAMAKAASIDSLGTDEEGTYSFYEIIFEADGEEVEIDEDDIIADVKFKDEAPAMKIADGVATKL